MRSQLEDLDELILRCRDEKARQYLAEAVYSYRAGAFRSAIVATWVAVCFDIIEKLRELALAGDKEAEKHVTELDSTRRAGDVTRALKFEKDLLQLAKEKFELISPLEYVDIERLQADRNRCAHPSLTADDQAYTPSAELARLHIHSAVTHLLQHPPVQGKYALDRLKQEIESDYFPIVSDDAHVFLSSGPLKRPRESLVRNLILILVKILVAECPEYKRRRRLSAAIAAVRKMHPEWAERPLRERLSTIFRSVEDSNLIVAIDFLDDVPNCWHYLEADVKQRLENYVRALPSEHIEYLEFLLAYPHLRDQACARSRAATKEELGNALFGTVPKEVGDRYISIYLHSNSFAEANSWAKELTLHIGDFDVEQERRIIEGGAKNAQIYNSVQFGPLMEKLRANGKLANAELDALLLANGLDEFVAEPKEFDDEH